MKSASIAPRTLSPFLAVLAGLAFLQGACGLGSLDYLKNGRPRDGAARDRAGADVDKPSTPNPDAAISDAFGLDALASGGSGGTVGEGAGTDALASGGETDSGAVGGMVIDGADDLSVGGTGGAGGALINGADGTEVVDVALEIDSGNGDRPDGPIRDEAFADSSVPDRPVVDSPIIDSPLAKPSALFVVGAIPLGTGDAAIQTRLVGKGYDVTLVKDTNLASVTSVGATVVLISHTVTPANVTTKFRSTARPVMVWQPSIYANMGFVDGTLLSQGSSLLGYSTLVMNSASGQLAAGLAGTVTVLQNGANMNYAAPNGQALTVASIPGLSSSWAIFAYESGAQMYNLMAPARRVGFFLGEKNATDLTANGWLLFDSALAWLSK